MIIKNLDKAGPLLDLTVSKRLKSGLVILKPGEDIGVHVTKDREEVIIILTGEAMVYLENQKSKVKANQLVYIPHNKEHNVKNETNSILRYIYLVNLD